MKKSILIVLMLTLLFVIGCNKQENVTYGTQIKQELNQNICKNMEYTDMKDDCYFKLAKQTSDADYCEEITAQSNRDVCYNFFEAEENDISSSVQGGYLIDYLGMKHPIRTDADGNDCELLLEQMNKCYVYSEKLSQILIETNNISAGSDIREKGISEGCPDISSTFGRECVDCEKSYELVGSCVKKNYQSNNETLEYLFGKLMSELWSGQLEHCEEEFSQFSYFCGDYREEKLADVR